MKDYTIENPFKIRDFKEWESELAKLTTEGKKLWADTGLADDIRKGWHEAAKKNQLFAFGPYSVPLDVVEAIEEDTKHMLHCAGIHKKPESGLSPDPQYIQSLKDRAKQLEEDVRAKQKQIDTLLGVIGELRAANNGLKQLTEIEIESDELF
jgi:hypothetical protein